MCVCSGCTPCYIGVYQCSLRSMEYCICLFVWGLEVCAHLCSGLSVLRAPHTVLATGIIVNTDENFQMPRVNIGKQFTSN